MQNRQMEGMKIQQKKWDEERDALKAEKKKYEYAVYDLLKAGERNKDKLKRMKVICDE